MVHSRLKTPKFQTSHAILTLSGKYLLQLRNHIPTISAPGQWSLFGGRVNDGETPLQAMKRELSEELEISPAKFIELWPIDYFAPFEKEVVRTWLFAAEVEDVWSRHKLNEGVDVQAFRYEELDSIDIPSVMKEAIRKYHEQKESSLKCLK